MGCILTPLNGLKYPNDTPRDVGCFLTHLRVGMNISKLDYSVSLISLEMYIGYFLTPMKVVMNISKLERLTDTPRDVGCFL